MLIFLETPPKIWTMLWTFYQHEKFPAKEENLRGGETSLHAFLRFNLQFNILLLFSVVPVDQIVHKWKLIRANVFPLFKILAFSIFSGECQSQPAIDDGKIELNSKSRSAEKTQLKRWDWKCKQLQEKARKTRNPCQTKWETYEKHYNRTRARKSEKQRRKAEN